MYRKLKKLTRSVSLQAKNVAIDLRLLEGQAGYNKFVILGWGRIGSNFLRVMLNSHPKIVTYNEIFRDYNTIDWGIPGHNHKTGRLLSLIQGQPVRFLETQIFRKYPRDIQAVGFKIFYYHAQQQAWKPVWSYLRDCDISVIHLKRKNRLKTYFSEMRAWKTNEWIDTGGGSGKSVTITLDYEECIKKFETMQKSEEDFDSLFRDSKKIELFYEDLVEHRVDEMKRVLEFLGVTYQDLKPGTYKQTQQSLFENISNYQELKRKFSNTKWADFFD